MANAAVGTAKAGSAIVGGAAGTGNTVSSDVTVNLSLAKAVGKSGFGIPLILAGVSAAAALVGAIAQKQPETYTCKNLILKNMDPLELDDAAVQTIHDKGCLTFVTKAGDNVTTEGKTIGGEYIDIMDGKDYIIYRIQHDSQRILNQSSKVPYNNNGIAQLEAACVGVMKDCYGDGNLIIATGSDGKPAYTVK